MNSNDTFDLAIQVEEKMSECYKELSRFCQNESISKELMTLSKEEIDHMNLLTTGKKYLKEAPDIFNVKSNRIIELKAGLNRLIRLMDNVQKGDINIEEALNDTAELERLFEQFHLKTIAEVEDPSLKKLFEILSKDDRIHTERLLNILTSFYHSN